MDFLIYENTLSVHSILSCPHFNKNLLMISSLQKDKVFVNGQFSSESKTEQRIHLKQLR